MIGFLVGLKNGFMELWPLLLLIVTFLAVTRKMSKGKNTSTSYKMNSCEFDLVAYTNGLPQPNGTVLPRPEPLNFTNNINYGFDIVAYNNGLPQPNGSILYRPDNNLGSGH